MNTKQPTQERILRAPNGMLVLLLNTAFIIMALGYGCISLVAEEGIPFAILCLLYAFIIGPIIYSGLKVIRPNEALVLTLFGKYHGTLKKEGFYYVNPFTSSFNPTSERFTTTQNGVSVTLGKKVSLKAMTLVNDRQKINDQMGNPIIIGMIVIWKVVNTAQAVFDVDNFKEFLTVQCDSALRNIVRLYPYDSAGGEHERSLTGSSVEISQKLTQEIQSKVAEAGLEIVEAKITHLSYAEEIAAAMLQRQQAAAVVDARQVIVDGAVGMVEMALSRLNEKSIVTLDEERKAAMVSNLLVVLCGNKDAQPIVNSGSIY